MWNEGQGILLPAVNLALPKGEEQLKKEGIRMKFFIDTANVKEIREAASLGVVDGVTTNPSLIAKEGRDFRQVIAEICSIVDGPISAEAVSLEADKMVAEGTDLAKIHKNVVVKLPMTKDGLKATKVLAGKRHQGEHDAGLLAVAGAACRQGRRGLRESLRGRLDDISQYGMDLVRQVMTIYDNYGYATEVIVASVRNPLHVVDAALAGAHIATIPFSVHRPAGKASADGHRDREVPGGLEEAGEEVDRRRRLPVRNATTHGHCEASADEYPCRAVPP